MHIGGPLHSHVCAFCEAKFQAVYEEPVCVACTLQGKRYSAPPVERSERVDEGMPVYQHINGECAVCHRAVVVRDSPVMKVHDVARAKRLGGAGYCHACGSACCSDHIKWAGLGGEVALFVGVCPMCNGPLSGIAEW